jgi:Ala-tRNA(Pro) deacylase
MSATAWVTDYLMEHQVPFEELHHPDAYTAQQVAQSEHVSGHRVAKVVVVMADGKPVELVLPASRRVNLDWVRSTLGVREVRLATEDEIRQHFQDCEVGAIPALRHWAGVDVLMDASMRVDGDIVFQAGTHHDAIRLNFSDWFMLVCPQVGRFTEPVGTKPYARREETKEF